MSMFFKSRTSKIFFSPFCDAETTGEPAETGTAASSSATKGMVPKETGGSVSSAAAKVTRQADRPSATQKLNKKRCALINTLENPCLSTAHITLFKEPIPLFPHER